MRTGYRRWGTMKSWWEARKRWEKVAVAIVAYLVLRNTVSGPITRFFGGTGTSESTPLSGSIAPLLILLGTLLLVSLLFVAMMARSVGTSVRHTRFVSTPEFRMPHRVGGAAVTHPLSPKAATPEVVIEELAAMGFRPAGSYDVDLADHSAVFACMLCSEGSTLAVVTPVHLTLQSDIDGKVLVTSDRTTGATYAPWVLHQVASDRSPEAVWRTHQRALNTLQQRGIVPTVFDVETAATVAAGIDHASVAHFRVSNQTRSMMAAFLPGAKRLIDESARSHNDIDRWLAYPDRWIDTA